MRLFIAAALLSAVVHALPTRVAAAPGQAQAGHDHAAHDHAAHDHAEAGPHGGALFELGAEAYHAELVLDEKMDQVTVVLLDSAASRQVAISEPYLLVNVRGGGKPRQYRLAPLYAQGKPASGPTAMYALVSKPLMGDLHRHDASAKLVVRVAGKPYSTSLEHDHDHSGHNH
ncbi:hypothetical protein Pla108_40090 [Botrimarina colliarenosi]|uniref:Uncharacterized protein n=1 Tax=Botrimarina colliarenosi TaxID=2528001 RepID=A0A5C5ZZY5_9BACT|nr:hypothetical protein [Botrimarina colliarenosi]TWT92869.1 hypothetical protein Pla108_40090 [Botrimarina colliarenosi]